jgi:hypothetical protein
VPATSSENRFHEAAGEFPSNRVSRMHWSSRFEILQTDSGSTAFFYRAQLPGVGQQQQILATVTKW